MPHRLRRIFGINLRTPRDQGTSCRIVELDTRGAVMALGANGVGKTSFLRLIPLFYGAQPSRILRGSGHESMMRHMLPEPTSCVVFEYERESEDDLRCTVVHCDPDEDAPQFHIIRSGFDERFFTREDESGSVFLNREEFKSATEKLGPVVSPAMSLSQYRCVILGDKAETKDMVRFRRLAAEHSLAPRMLRGLDQIAAAMGPEALSFNTLQEIVTGRIAARLGAEGKSMRELKKPAKDVVSWLASHEHLSRVEAKRPDAVELSKRCADIQTINLELSQMRAAAETLLEQKQTEIAANRARRVRIEDQGQRQAEELLAHEQAAKASYEERVQEVDGLTLTVRAIEVQNEHYEDIGIGALEAEHDREQGLLERRTGAEREKLNLDQQAQGILTTADARRRDIERELGAVQRRVAGEKERQAIELARRQEALRLEQAAAVEALATPARLATIPSELQRLAGKEGELKQARKNPQASPETLGQIEAVGGQLRAARTADQEAQETLRKVQDATRAADKALDRAVHEHEEARVGLEQQKAHVADLESRLKPKPGSLLEFLRATAPADLRAIAKVVDTKLLERTDLGPQHDPEIALAEAAALNIGSVALDVQGVDVPDWLDEPELRRTIDRAKQEVQRAIAHEQSTQTVARRAGVSAHDAAQAEAAASARSNAAREAVTRLEQQDAELRDQASAEVAERKQLLEDELLEVQDKIRALRAEEDLLRVEQGEQRRKLDAEFDQRRLSLGDEMNAAVGRLAAELAAADERASQGFERLEQQTGEELRAAGVDAQRVQTLTSTIEDLAARLLAISNNRHEVTAWRAFRDGELVRLPAEKVRLTHAKEARGLAQRRWSEAQEAMTTHAQKVREHLEDIDGEHKKLRDDVNSLESILNRELLVIRKPAGNYSVSTWTVEDLLSAVTKKNSELASTANAANGHIRAIRQAMQSTEGPATEWLARKDAELPDVQDLPQHLDTLRRGRMLCEWYEADYASAVGMLRNELNAVLGQARQFVKDMEDFDREIGRFNRELQDQMSRVTRFPSFGNLKVGVRSTVKSLEYMGDLQRMKDLADSRQSLSRAPGAPVARELALPGTDEVQLMRRLRDLLLREGGIRTSLNELVRLECSLQVNGRERVISREDEFKKYASNGNTGMIVAMFLMGFASIVRKDAGGDVRLTWITDEAGRFDGPNLQAFLSTLDDNHIDVISAAPEAAGGAAEMFDRLARFYPTGNIVTAECEALHVV